MSSYSQIHLTLTSHACGELQICSLAFRLSSTAASATTLDSNSSASCVAGFVTLEVQGARMNATKEERLGKIYAPDRRLNLIITEPLPKLEVTFI